MNRTFYVATAGEVASMVESILETVKIDPVFMGIKRPGISIRLTDREGAVMVPSCLAPTPDSRTFRLQSVSIFGVKFDVWEEVDQ